uniref:Exocyst subunit Exo70 family protein n=1 Tax=Helianthus annuus TaxID=4232 RepID=A0A251TNF8_HELAN
MGSPENNITAEQIILRWDSTASEDARTRMIFEQHDRQEIIRYLQAVDQIQTSMNSTTLSDGESKKLNNAIQIAMARLEDEECVQVYGSVRKSVVDGSFKKLGVEKLSIGDIQRLDWEAMNAKIGRWIRAAKVCIRVLFASEKKLCRQIFEDLGSMAADDACFIETVKAPANQLFNFVEAISISRRSPEKLFKILDLHDSLLDLLPDIDDVFDSKPAESIRIQAPEILSRLAEAARGMLSEFENAVLREPSKVPVPGGTIHPLTRYVMNYISLISDYKQTLGEIIISRPTTGSRHCDVTAPEMDFDELDEQPPLI